MDVSEQPPRRPVLVVGAGPAGASLAYVLASRGLDVVLLDRQLDFEREFRGEVLMPGGFEALAQAGLAAPLARVPEATFDEIEAFANGRSFVKVDANAAGLERPPAALSQPALLEMIVNEASRFPSFRFEAGATVLELLREDGRVHGVRVRGKDGEREIHGSLVVGADGRSSVVRRRAGIAFRSDSVVMDAVWCKLPLPPEMGDRRFARVYIGHGHLLIGYRSWDDLLQVAWVIRKGTYGELKASGIDEWVEKMADHVSPDWAAHLRKHKGDLSRPFLLDVKADRVGRWSVPGVLLIGDAAHAMSPVGGQGLNVALRDSIVAANHLVPALRDGGDPRALDAAAARVGPERVEEIAPIQRIQSLPPHIMLGRSRLAGAVRDLLPPLTRFALRTGIAEKLAPRLAGPFFFGRTDVTLRV